MNVDLLPSLRVGNIEHQARDQPFEVTTKFDLEFYWRRAPTNGIVYVNGVVNAKRVPEELRPYIPLYNMYLTKLGAGMKRNWKISRFHC